MLSLFYFITSYYMRSLNKVLLIGNLTKDPEMIDLDSGIKMAKFSLATNHGWKAKDGEKKQMTDFHNVIVWRKLAELAQQYLKKGAAVLVEGKLHNNKFQDKEGKNKTVTEVHADEINFITYKKNADIDEINLVSVEAN